MHWFAVLAWIAVRYRREGDIPLFGSLIMLRSLILVIGVVSAALLIPVEPAEARPWSPGNPGTRSNIHGITYRSMKWEQDRRTGRPFFRRSRSGFFRRR